MTRLSVLRAMLFLLIPAIAYYAFTQLPNRTRVDEELANCFGATEQLILLRQLALADKAREAFDWCMTNDEASRMMGRSDVATEDWCRALYLNANVPVRTCMREKGYIFTDPDSGNGTCDWSRFRNPNCYRPGWEFYFTPKSRSNFSAG
jgi:hypothetical protein